jgi:membrane protein YqaA with SNARE-associated domain
MTDYWCAPTVHDLRLGSATFVTAPQKERTRREAWKDSMIVTVFVILAIAAFVLTLLAAINRVPLWIAVVILCLIELLRALPLGR